MNRPRLLLADDHPETGELLRDLLHPEFDVIATVQDGRRARSQRRGALAGRDRHRHRDGGPRRHCRRDAILRRNPAARIIFVTVHSDTSLVKCGLATGALGYVLKLAAGDDLVPAVRAALRGERLVSQTLHYSNGTTRKS